MPSEKNIFNAVSGIYGKFFDFQIGYFNKITERAQPEFDVSKFNSVLDVGCGTGALSHVLADRGLKVVGVDPSEGMLKQAREKIRNKDIELMRIIPGEPLPFQDNSFDFAISSYVAHGLKPEARKFFYAEMKRVAAEYVIIHDYNQKRALHTTIIEWLEGGDYFNFIRTAADELRTVFDEVRVADVDKRAAWYICSVVPKSSR